MELVFGDGSRRGTERVGRADVVVHVIRGAPAIEA